MSTDQKTLAEELRADGAKAAVNQAFVGAIAASAFAFHAASFMPEKDANEFIDSIAEGIESNVKTQMPAVDAKIISDAVKAVAAPFRTALAQAYQIAKK